MAGLDQGCCQAVRVLRALGRRLALQERQGLAKLLWPLGPESASALRGWLGGELAGECRGLGVPFRGTLPARGSHGQDSASWAGRQRSAAPEVFFLIRTSGMSVVIAVPAQALALAPAPEGLLLVMGRLPRLLTPCS